MKKYIKLKQKEEEESFIKRNVNLNKYYEIIRETDTQYLFRDECDQLMVIYKTKNSKDYIISEGHPYQHLIQKAADLSKTEIYIGGFFQYKNIEGIWTDCAKQMVPMFEPTLEFRLKPHKIKIGDREFNAPEREALEIGQKYFIADIVDEITEGRWNNDIVDNIWLKNGIIFLNEEDAIAVTAAIFELLKENGFK